MERAAEILGVCVAALHAAAALPRHVRAQPPEQSQVLRHLHREAHAAARLLPRPAFRHGTAGRRRSFGCVPVPGRSRGVVENAAPLDRAAARADETVVRSVFGGRHHPHRPVARGAGNQGVPAAPVEPRKALDETPKLQPQPGQVQPSFEPRADEGGCVRAGVLRKRKGDLPRRRGNQQLVERRGRPRGRRRDDSGEFGPFGGGVYGVGQADGAGTRDLPESHVHPDRVPDPAGGCLSRAPDCPRSRGARP
mmetsp:Transcript_5245/g.9896  ORF Transcript_5245/g.9896 Transcript_5245/m.9896 type:complete len:251 (+) Transcript_5245:145-897(+)